MADGAIEDRQAAPMNPDAQVMVRFLQDCDQFMGADGETYPPGKDTAFKNGEIATIPAPNASALIGHGVAVDVSPPNPAPVAGRVTVMIPSRLRTSDYRFLLVDRQSKKPTETDWPKYTFDDSRLLSHLSIGGNYGIAPGFGGLCVLDADDPQRLEELGILGLFAETFSVSNDGGARQHKYFTCNKPPWKKLILTDPELKDDKGRPKHLGEVFCQGNFQVVGPGSIHPSGRRYEVTNDAPLQEFPRDEIEHIFSRFMKKEIPPENVQQYSRERWNTSKSRRDPVLHVEDHLMPNNSMTRGDEIQGAHPVHGSETGMNLSINPKKGIWHCFRCSSGGDALLAFAVQEGIIPCHEAGPGALKNRMKEVREALRKRGYLKDGDTAAKNEAATGREGNANDSPAPDRTEKPYYPINEAERQAAKRIYEAVCKYHDVRLKDGVTDIEIEKRLRGENYTESEIKEIVDGIDKWVPTRAKGILLFGNPLEFILAEFKKLHAGDEGIAIFLLAGVGCQSVTNSDGLQPNLTGESGKGKSDACKKVFHLLPPEYARKTLFSDKALFRSKILAGTTLLFDDNADMGPFMLQTFKIASADFQHETVREVADQKTKTNEVLPIPPRLNFWFTSVSGAYEDQVISRQLSLQVDETKAIDRKVAGRVLAKFYTGDPPLPESENILIAREITRIIKIRSLITVRAPYAKKIDWNNCQNRRDLPMFLNIILGRVAYLQDQRERDEAGNVLADESDFLWARDLWKSISKTQGPGLNKKEAVALQLFLDHKKGDAVVELSRSDLMRTLKFKSGDLAKTMDGVRQRDGTYAGGLVNKVGGFVKEQRLDKRDSESVTKRYDVYIYSGPADILDWYADVVVLRDQDVDYD